MTIKLSPFYFSQQALFIIPIEHLGPEGMSEDFATALMEARDLSRAWIDCFNEAYSSYWQRATTLFTRAPEEWFPARAQNLCIVSEPALTRPYFQVFPDASWLLYESDFTRVEGTPELAIYQLFHAERLGLTKNPVTAFVHNLSYFLLRSDEALSLFHEQAARAAELDIAVRRPDASAFVHFGTLLSEVRRIYHATLNPPTSPLPEKCGRLAAAGIIVPLSLQPALSALSKVAKGTAQEVAERYLSRQRQGAGRQHAEAVAEWLTAQAPRVLLVVNGEVMWDPDKPGETDALKQALGEIGALPAEALRADLEVIDQRSRGFLAALREPSALPQGEDFEQDGGVYIHEGRQLIVYDAVEPSLNRLHEGTPPYHRWLLGARTAHEWGHLAVEAGWVHVPEELREADKLAREDVALVLRRIFADAPGPLRDILKQEQQQLGAGNAEPGAVWSHYLLTRMPDYQTNLLMRRFAEPHELEAYVRVNVRNHTQDGIGPYQQVMRYAFEYQYLSLSQVDDPLRYLVSSTWFDELFVQAGIVSLERMQALWRAVGRVCDCQHVDKQAFISEAE